MSAKAIMKACLVVAILSSWMLAAQGGTPPTALAVAGTWQPRATAFARVSARRQAVLRLPFSARITALPVEPGMRVTAGEELARFEAPLLRRHLAAWQQARQEQALARERLQMLREGEAAHAITRRDLAQGEQAMAAARGKANLAWETLAADLDLIHVTSDAGVLAKRLDGQGVRAVARSLGRLRAPFAGVVTDRRVALGEQLAAGDPVLELEALDSVYVDVGVSGRRLAIWRDGETHWQAGEKPIALRPLDGMPLYDAATGLWRLRFETDNPGLALRDGAWIEVEHLGAARSVVWVPAQAVVARNGKTWCIVQAGDRFRAAEVQVGAAVEGRIPVLSGLEAGSRVVIEGAYELLYRDLKELIKFVD